MTKKIHVADLPDFDAAEYLDSEQAIAEYLTVVLEDNDASLLAAALGDIARARGMSEIAKQYGVAEDLLREANGIDDPNAISEGQALRIPLATPQPTSAPGTHRVQPSETLTGIALRMRTCP